jgi:protein-tyrosine-phosphatase
MKFLFTVALLVLFAASPADAQIRAKAKQGIINQKQLKQQKQQKQADAIERFLAMSPDERRKALAQLPPQRQRQILQRLRTLELLSEDERNLLRGRLQDFSGMTVDRRQAVRGELQNLRKMSREDRRRRLGSDEVKQNFSEEERQLLYDVFGQPEQQEE